VFGFNGVLTDGSWFQRKCLDGLFSDFQRRQTCVSFNQVVSEAGVYVSWRPCSKAQNTQEEEGRNTPS
jgi:hypothetical protein